MHITKNYEVGDKVTDPQIGFATVTFVGTDYIGLLIEKNHKHGLFKSDGLQLRPGWDESVLAVGNDQHKDLLLPWPDSTFIPQSDVAHYQGSHWDAFFENSAAEILERLPEITTNANILRGYGDFYRPRRPAPDKWSQGVHLVWPNQNDELCVVMTLLLGQDVTELVSCYPYIEGGKQTTVRLECVHVWESGLEAQIGVQWGDVSVTFFDAAFLINRGWYETNREYDFLLAGIAYDARPAENTPIPFNLHPDQAIWQNMLAVECDETHYQAQEYLDLTGAACFVPVPEWDLDDYRFRGPIKRVTPFSGNLGQDGWKLRVTVMRMRGEDADLDIFITRRVWQGKEPPAIGKDIEGRLWLQGRLWSVNRDAGTDNW